MPFSLDFLCGENPWRGPDVVGEGKKSGLKISWLDPVGVCKLPLRKPSKGLGCTPRVGVEGRDIGWCFGNAGGTIGVAGLGCWNELDEVSVLIFGSVGGVVDFRWLNGELGFFEDEEGTEKDPDADNIEGVGGALEVSGIGLGLGFEDRWKIFLNGDNEGDGATVGVNIDALGLSVGAAEAEDAPAAFEEKPLTSG